MLLLYWTEKERVRYLHTLHVTAQDGEVSLVFLFYGFFWQTKGCPALFCGGKSHLHLVIL